MSATSARLVASPRQRKTLHLALWGVQLLLFAAFGVSGVAKLTQPLASLAAALPWTADVPGALVRFIGLSELLGALGLVLPAATRIKPWLTPLAALGLVTVTVLAAGFHFSRGDRVTVAAPSLALGALAAVVAWGRGRAAPIAPRVTTRRSPSRGGARSSWSAER
jgi:putative oxidoreductase